jgi:hypothetical protein
MMVNLENPIYRQTVLDNKSRGGLATILSSLDGSMEYRSTPMFQNDLEIVGGRLPKADKKIVGKAGFAEVVSMLSNEYCKSQHQLEV